MNTRKRYTLLFLIFSFCHGVQAEESSQPKIETEAMDTFKKTESAKKNEPEEKNETVETAYGTETNDENLLNEIADLKENVLKLNRDLFILEEDLLFPANTQVSIFVSINKGQFFTLESIKLKLNDKNLSGHLYTKAQVSALTRGGLQRLYIGNLKNGKHHISAFITGKGPNNRYYRRATELTFEKTSNPAVLEIKIEASQEKQQAVFSIQEWGENT